jgi:5-deoxy-glucuronate isomerase
MPRLIRVHSSAASTIIVPAGESLTDLAHFQLLRLDAGKEARVRVPGFETLFVVLSGRADIVAGRERFEDVGRRADIWSGCADSVYAGTGEEVIVTSRLAGTEVAVAGGKCTETFAPFRISPEDVEMVDVGSVATHSRRRIFHILGQRAAGRAGHLLVSELCADPGCWSGYPPHKHDTERPPEETDFQEIYHYRFRPESGFGTQFCYAPDGAAEAVMTRHGDTFLVDRGYHPTATSPGHEGYIFTILVGRHQRSLIQYFDPAHGHLMSAIPGLQAMRDKFK